MSPLPLLGLVTVALCLVFAAVYFLGRRLNNYGVVDVAWSYAFGCVAIACSFFSHGWPARRWLFGGMVAVWSARLGTHLWRRVASHHPQEDARYAQLRKDWGANFASKMMGFFQLQAVSVALLGLLFFAIAANPAPAFFVVEWVGIGVWALAFLGEAMADAQLARFKRENHDRGRVCDVGLWRYSRHPNYFFEWMIWVGYAVFALGSSWGWVGLLSPACILWLLLRVTGIPLTEEQSLRSKGEAYRRYQQMTSAFVPWFRRPAPKSKPFPP